MRVSTYHYFVRMIHRSNRLQLATNIQPSTTVFSSRFCCTKSEKSFGVAPKNEIAIIGAGISGLGALRGMAAQYKTANNLLSQYERVSIHIFEKERAFGSGYPYSLKYRQVFFDVLFSKTRG